MENAYNSHIAENSDPSTSSLHDSSSDASELDLLELNVVKTENVEPIFRLIQNYDRRLLYAQPKPQKNMRSKTSDEFAESMQELKNSGELFAEETIPVWHRIKNRMITPSVIGENLWQQFKDLPTFGAPEDPSKFKEFQDKFIREFVGGGLSDAEYEKLKKECSPDNLKSGEEVQMDTKYPVLGVAKCATKVRKDDDDQVGQPVQKDDPDLQTLKRLTKRQKSDDKKKFSKLLKYRGVKMFPLTEQVDPTVKDPPELQPGKDVIYEIRIYRPYSYKAIDTGGKTVHRRHPVFSCNMIVTNRTPLTTMRDKFACRNDLDMRLDISEEPDSLPATSAKTVFPSGFMFINNVFYVDTRDGCRDNSAVIRHWAEERGMGTFPVQSMDNKCVGDILVRLAYPEVYVHQGNCEHMFLFSDIRLVQRNDPLLLSSYPTQTMSSQNQMIYCTTCAEFAAKWLIIGTDRVPFDPTFFCERCFKEYMYKDGKKIGNFKAYIYKGNELNVKTVVTNLTMELAYN